MGSPAGLSGPIPLPHPVEEATVCGMFGSSVSSDGLPWRFSPLLMLEVETYLNVGGLFGNFLVDILCTQRYNIGSAILPPVICFHKYLQEFL